MNDKQEQVNPNEETKRAPAEESAVPAEAPPAEPAPAAPAEETPEG